ncbi:MAG: response regulator [Elusimicrobiota bacterium]
MPPKKILVVDDDEVLNRTIRNILEGAGYETVFAFDGHQTISFAKEAKPDLVLLDLIMPGRMGDDVYNELKLTTGMHNVPILIISGAPPEDIIKLARARKIAKEDIFIKPFDYGELLSRVNHYLSG